MSVKTLMDEGLVDDAHSQLLEDYAKKPVRRYLQVDGFARWTGACGEPPEPTDTFPEGFDVFMGEVYELRRSGPELAVRVQIPDGADRDQVLALLDEIRDWLVFAYAGSIDATMGYEDREGGA